MNREQTNPKLPFLWSCFYQEMEWSKRILKCLRLFNQEQNEQLNRQTYAGDYRNTPKYDNGSMSKEMNGGFEAQLRSNSFLFFFLYLISSSMVAPG